MRSDSRRRCTSRLRGFRLLAQAMKNAARGVLCRLSGSLRRYCRRPRRYNCTELQRQQQRLLRGVSSHMHGAAPAQLILARLRSAR